MLDTEGLLDVLFFIVKSVSVKEVKKKEANSNFREMMK